MSYFSDLVSSFKPGGQTPLQALFRVPEDVDSIEDYMHYMIDFQAESPSQWAAILGDETSLSQLQVAANSGDTVSDTSSYLDELMQGIDDATERQNLSAQASADRAMEFTAEQNRIDREFQAQQAQKAMDYQTEMSNTAYQRAMADMKAAGLNPKLVSQLGGASSPSGVAASGTGGSQGTSASMSMANMSALAGVMESYITGADALDRNKNDFVQGIIRSLITYFGLIHTPASAFTKKIGF